MTYLELINAVLDRLREDRITAVELDSNPYYRVIGTHVNDAKSRVEDAWDWSYLRGTDLVQVADGEFQAELPNSFDNQYILKRAFASDQYSNVFVNVPAQVRMRQVNVEEIRRLYQAGSLNGLPVGTPDRFAITGRASNGNIQITMYPAADRDLTITVDRVAHQAPLTAATDVLLLPSLPVYTLATALASRERGEVGGTPVSELFALADRHLSDAIAVDSALYPSEVDFYSAGTGWGNTNVGHA
jgi:hypothetical protein